MTVNCPILNTLGRKRLSKRQQMTCETCCDFQSSIKNVQVVFLLKTVRVETVNFNQGTAWHISGPRAQPATVAMFVRFQTTEKNRQCIANTFNDCCDQELHKILLVSEANLEPKTLPCLYLFPSVGIQSRKIQEKVEGERLRGVRGQQEYVSEGMGLRVEKPRTRTRGTEQRLPANVP